MTHGFILVCVVAVIIVIVYLMVRYHSERKFFNSNYCSDCNGCHGCDGENCTINDDCDKCVDINCEWNPNYDCNCGQCAEVDCDGCLFNDVEGDEESG